MQGVIIYLILFTLFLFVFGFAAVSEIELMQSCKDKGGVWIGKHCLKKEVLL